MELGTRPIRTAGRGSGSVEVTLPAGLRPMVGLPCRILLHDGAQPDIVLRPDLGVARDAFAQLWCRVRDLLDGCGALGHQPAWPADAFSFVFYPQWNGAGMPRLAWQDGLLLAAGPGQDAALARAAAAQAAVLAEPCGILPDLAAMFGAGGTV